MTSDKGVVERLTKAQQRRLERVGYVPIQSASDLDAYDTLSVMGLVTVEEPSPGRFSVRLTDKGRAALSRIKGDHNDEASATSKVEG